MSVPDHQLWWWKKDNKPDKVRCDRNGCDRKATLQVAWRHIGIREGQGSKHEWRHIACDSHADWWIQKSGASVAAHSLSSWTPI